MGKDTPGASSIGSTFREYRVKEKLGVGARSTVYKIQHPDTGKLYALKHVSKVLPEDERYLRHLTNEYENICKIQNGPGEKDAHPNIVCVYDLFKERKLLRVTGLSMLLEYVPGKNLGQRSDLPMKRLIDVLIQTCKALQRMHEMGYLHCDLKPDNIIVMHNGWAKVIDFGFSCKTNTELGNLKGTRDFIAPEQVSGGVVTEQTDMYNLGATFYKVFTGQAVPAVMPSMRSESAIFLSGDTIRATPPAELNPQVPVWLSDIIMQCIEKKPRHRPARITDVLNAVETEKLRMELGNTDQ
ncbi:MAG TPA: serine/threonine-protein kinase [Candidatus Brocadiia bacterium]|nr:serine/threonine-protein kinase [Candidatus Brocadiia bacterium]